METLACRLLPFEAADGAANMATDEVLLQAALAGVATLRFYSWSEPTLSLGYFQSEKLRYADPALAALPFVRRPTGGEALVHHHELTYALALPAGTWQRGNPWPARMHEIVVTALSSSGIEAKLCAAPVNRRFQGLLCFQHLTASDVTVHGAKVVGSAQRKRRGAILQHGGILLARSPHAPMLPGIRELSGHNLAIPQAIDAVHRAFAEATGTRLVQQSLDVHEKKMLQDLKINKYLTTAWTCKR